MCAAQNTRICGCRHLARTRPLLKQELIFGSEPNAHATALGPTPISLKRFSTHPAYALNRQGNEPLQERGFGQLLQIRQGAEVRLRLRCDPSNDELRGSHVYQVFNNSRREAILRFTPNSTETRSAQRRHRGAFNY